MLIVFSTDVGIGKGGISTALVSVKEQLLKKNNVTFFASHSQSKKFLWLRSLLFTINNVKKGDVVWLHCGLWLSIFRKIYNCPAGKSERR